MPSLANSSRVSLTLLLAVLVGLAQGAPPPNLPRTVETSGVEFITPRTEAALQQASS